MTVASGVLAAALLASPLPPPQLPAQGLVMSDRNGITFVDLTGRRLGAVAGLRFADDYLSGLPRFVDRRGRLWALDRRRRRFVPAATGQQLYGRATLSYVRSSQTWLVQSGARRVLMRVRTPQRSIFVSERRDVVTSDGRALDLRTRRIVRVPRACDVAGGARPHWLLLCRKPGYVSQTPRTIEELVAGRRHVIARPPGKSPAPNVAPVGHWAGIRLSPDGRSLLAQWSAECETPVAFLVSRGTGRVRRLGGEADESIGLAWTTDGRALVFFPTGVCGGTFRRGAGVYAVGGEKSRLVVATAAQRRVAMWGG